MSTILALGVGLAGCASEPAAVSEPAVVTRASATPAADLESLFGDYGGSLVVYDLNDRTYTRVRPERAKERLRPASTFKVLNSLVALQTGVVDEDEVIDWNGQDYGRAEWNRDQTIQTAIRDSVVWFYQELARRIGRARMKEYVAQVGYGNESIAGDIDSFWLDGGLKISAQEQVEFLADLYAGRLPFSAGVMATVRRLLVQEDGLSGKTGSGRTDDGYVGWFVGHVEAGDGEYVFATNLTSPDEAVSGAQARKVTVKALRRFGITD